MNKKLWLYLVRRTNRLTNKELRILLTLTRDYQQIKWNSTEVIKRLKLDNKRGHLFHIHYNEQLKQLEHIKALFQQDSFITIHDLAYPELLKKIYDPPAMLFYCGNLQLLQQNCIAFIGSRAANPVVLPILDHLLPDLIKANYVIVSGLAKGIDTWSHQRCIYHHGSTIAVLGNGLDYYYPKQNARLQKEIAKKHLLISEYPLQTKPHKYHFPLRNRIIAGLSRGVCVMQAGLKSGTEITANLALEEGREVFAIPYAPNQAQFLGCNLLIQEGAKLVIEAKDILETLAYSHH